MVIAIAMKHNETQKYLKKVEVMNFCEDHEFLQITIAPSILIQNV